MPHPARTRAAALLVALLAIPPAAHAQTAWQEGFEGPQPSWRDAGGNAQYRVVEHRRLPQVAHAGNGCEWLRIEGSGGGYVYFAHDIGRPRVIDELAPSLWIKSDRAGPYLAVRVVLPRTADPRSGKPVATILTGAAYTDVGRWQQLGLAGLPTLLTRQIHVLRMQFGPQVDGHEAYVDAVLLNVYGGPGATNVWIDDLEVAGHAASAANLLVPVRLPPIAEKRENSLPSPAETGPNLLPSPTGTGPNLLPSPAGRGAGGEGVSDGEVASLQRLPSVHAERPHPSPLPAGEGTIAQPNPLPAGEGTVAPGPRRTLKLAGALLTLDDRPLFPRVIQHRGEPLATLKKIGFNAVWLQRLPTPELFEEADRLQLLLICPPPPRAATPLADIGPAFDCVLAWDLGNDLTDADLEPTERWAEQVRAADRRVNRPLICRPRADLRGYSRVADLLLIDRRPLGTSLEFADYAAWVRRQPLLAKPDTPIWTTVQTQPNESLREQLLAVQPGAAVPLCVPSEQIRLLAYTAVVSGSRGLLFLSDSPLDAPDADTQQRAMSLELLNLELDAIEPWAAAGSFIAAAESNVPEVTAAVLRTEHAPLLLPIWSAPLAQYAPPQSAANALTLVAPAVPAASKAFELTPGGVRSLRSTRVAGGTSVTLDEFGLTAQVLFAQEPSIIAAVHRRAAQFGRRAAELQRHLAVHKFNTVQTTVNQLAALKKGTGSEPLGANAVRNGGREVPVPLFQQVPRLIETARASLQTCDGQLAAGDAPAAAQNAQRAMRSLRLVERAYWDAAVKTLSSPVASPGAVGFDTLPYHWRLVERLAGVRFGLSRIAGGDFENLDTMTRAGWRYIPHGSSSVQPAADLAPDAAHSGRLGLRLAAAAVDPKKPLAVVETPPVLFTSPPVQVEAGQIVCVHGWAQVPAPIAGSSDGLLIVDSLSGEALADRIGRTDGWRQFVLYRVAPQSGPMCVTFALSGLGEARVDDVAIQVAEGGAAVSQR